MMDTYMAAFHVFVEGATDASATGLSKLADAIAAQYGLPAPALLARLQAGRFRVKGNIDRATAETYARDLTRLGARCAIEDAADDQFGGATPIPFPAKPLPDAAAPTRPTPPPSALPPRAATTPSTPPSALPPRTSPTPSAPPSALPARSAPTPSAPPSALPPRTGGPSMPPANSGQFQSGLSAAFSGESPAADLGALGRADAPFSLSTVDGADDGSPAAAGASDGGGFAASIGPAPEAPAGKSGKLAKAAKPKDEPLDMFAPPEMQGDEFKVDIASDERDVARASTPPPMDDAAADQSESSSRPSSQRIPQTPASQRLPTTPASQRIPTTPTSGRISKPSLDAPVDVVAPSSNRFGPLGEPRTRFAAGLFLAIILGFVPAHFIAKMREESAFETVDRKVIAAQQAAETLDMWQGLDRLRADQLARKESEKRNAAIIGFVLWALAGSGIAWVFFKKIPWDA